MTFARSLTGIKRLQDADALSVRVAAMDMLSRREYSQRELVFKLQDKGADAVMAESAVQELAEQNLQSDLRFAEMLVNSSLHKGRGPLRLEQDMEEHEIPANLFLPLLDAINVDWLALAKQVYEKKYGDSCVDDYNERAKRMRFLQGRGFNTSQIKSTIR